MYRRRFWWRRRRGWRRPLGCGWLFGGLFILILLLVIARLAFRLF